jgi:hypothetical protein
LENKIGSEGDQRMKKYVFGILAALVLVFGLTVGQAFAGETPAATSSTAVGPFEGIFYGTVSGDNNSRAPLALQMTHREGVVAGNLYLGEGLFIDAGICGKTEIPSMVQSASGRTLESNPNKLDFNTSIDIRGFEIGVNLKSTVSADGSTLEASTSIDLPWFCGRDPSYAGTLNRIQ